MYINNIVNIPNTKYIVTQRQKYCNNKKKIENLIKFFSMIPTKLKNCCYIFANLINIFTIR